MPYSAIQINIVFPISKLRIELHVDEIILSKLLGSDRFICVLKLQTATRSLWRWTCFWIHIKRMTTTWTNLSQAAKRQSVQKIRGSTFVGYDGSQTTLIYHIIRASIPEFHESSIFCAGVFICCFCLFDLFLLRIYLKHNLSFADKLKHLVSAGACQHWNVPWQLKSSGRSGRWGGPTKDWLYIG